jgi:hypothetical protein
VDYQSFGAVVRLLAVASMFVTVLNNIWRHGDIDLTGRYANMRTIFGRGMLIGVVIAALARINVVAMLRGQPAFSSYLHFYGVDLVDDVIGVLVTGVVLAFMSKFWNDLFDLLYELKRLVRGKANALRADEQPRAMREPRDMRDMRDMRRGGRGRGSRGGGGRGMGGSGMGDRGDRDRGDRDRGDRDRGDRDRAERERNDRERGRSDRPDRPEPPREPFGANP